MARPAPPPSAADRRSTQSLRLDGAIAVECPVCRHGQIQAMPLMETYFCNFCRHIFEANLEQQTMHVVDGVQPMGWRWQGWRWQPLYHSSHDITLTLWVVGLALVICPAGIVALGAYLFPPLEGTRQVNWPLVWALATWLVHTAMVGWLIAEHYQFPLYVLAKIRLRRLLEGLPG